ncbi:TPA: DUF5320 domain-containing protein [Clostridioides difficile]|uniref:DUF5320 domain-containing protein n=1 Tax=Clostridioides difficile TaxID=1496 RepID=UPI00093EF466|nr:DUF5320 domain-containing protein [Clostridioides difficile]EGT5475385.1 hypothetical protein [Clostridioides difficile]MBG0257303.1 DUF5320 domain-containing protein [Clostridioides difficile]MCA0551407.1 DUF5320 domain-containing protein [Clostridioides difficile]MDM9941689.1 DUF5320 domain-containing protein [Clostridioides difficile]MDV9292177.1 DUF5320 domain-containing protein [Clostridioides difficile]
MGKEEFNKLKVKDQVEYINKKLENKTLTEVCKDIKISRSTVRERFLKRGYLFDKNNNKYVYDSDVNNKPIKENKCKNDTKVLEEKIQVLESKIEAIENRLNNKSSSASIKKFEGKQYQDVIDFMKMFKKSLVNFAKKIQIIRYKIYYLWHYMSI